MIVLLSVTPIKKFGHLEQTLQSPLCVKHTLICILQDIIPHVIWCLILIVQNFYCLKIFEKYQLDAEWSLNAGCWMWLSCSAFFAKHPQWMCPVGLGKHLDPDGKYVR